MRACVTCVYAYVLLVYWVKMAKDEWFEYTVRDSDKNVLVLTQLLLDVELPNYTFQSIDKIIRRFLKPAGAPAAAPLPPIQSGQVVPCLCIFYGYMRVCLCACVTR